MSEARQAPPEPTLSPVLVALLTNSSRVTTDTVRRTLAELAGAGWFQFEDQNSDTPLLRITRRLDYDNLPPRYQHLLLKRIEHRAGEQPDVPLSAVLSSEGTDWYLWWTRFTTAVIDAAAAAGLVRRPVPARWSYPIMAASGTFSGVAADRAGAALGFALIFGLFAAVVPGGIFAGWLTKPYPTRAGREAARRAIREGRDSTPSGIDSLVPDVSELPGDQAWSSYGGHWHTVTVPAGPDASRARRALAEDRPQVVGRVVKRWKETHTTGGQGTTADFCFCCVDDGVSAEGWTFPVTDRDFQQLEAGDLVTMELDGHRLRFGHEPR